MKSGAYIAWAIAYSIACIAVVAITIFLCAYFNNGWGVLALVMIPTLEKPFAVPVYRDKPDK